MERRKKGKKKAKGESFTQTEEDIPPAVLIYVNGEILDTLVSTIDITNTSSKKKKLKQRDVAIQLDIKKEDEDEFSVTKIEPKDSMRLTMEQSLRDNKYICDICTNRITRTSAIWSCIICYHVFHHGCMMRWYRAGSAEQWKCPTCMTYVSDDPQEFKCYCRKMKAPIVNYDLPPFSCGKTCGKSLGSKCKQVCKIRCHPGPCPPCFTPELSKCYCGKQVIKGVCSQIKAVQCSETCKKVLNCGQHNCKMICHIGECNPCEGKKDIKCFCGKTTLNIKCGEKGIRNCNQICGKFFDCGKHSCEKQCHDGSCGICPFDVSVVKTCCCKKSSVGLLAKRKSCNEPLPVCTQTCNKVLRCGHNCPKKCHVGECGPCKIGTTFVTCKCPFKKRLLVNCTDIDIPVFCDTKCPKFLKCQRHKCANLCCQLISHPDCENICNHILNCGIHHCQRECHALACGDCSIVVYQTKFCPCGKTNVVPPFFCGSKTPGCKEYCRRPQPCGHINTHYCHSSNQDCQECIELVHAKCFGGHESKTIICANSKYSCGIPCNKTLGCGLHRCLQKCHDGPCESVWEICHQTCQYKRSDCGHRCNEPCHAGRVCPLGVCEVKILVKCPCGTKGEARICGSRGSPLECSEGCASLNKCALLAAALNINPTKPAFQPNYSNALKAFARQNGSFAIMVQRELIKLVKRSQQVEGRYQTWNSPCCNKMKRKFIHEYAVFFSCTTKAFDQEPNRNVVVSAYKSEAKIPTKFLVDN